VTKPLPTCSSYIDSGVIDSVINCIFHYGVKYYDTVIAITVIVYLVMI